MGLKKPDAYTVTKHCHERFMERFEINLTESIEMIKRYLAASTYIRPAKGENEMWANIDVNIVFILDVKDKEIVTVYPINDGINAYIHPLLAKELQETITKFKYKALRDFGNDTAELYGELNSLTEKLGKTSQPKQIDLSMGEINKNRRQLNRRIDDHKELLSSISIELSRVNVCN